MLKTVMMSALQAQTSGQTFAEFEATHGHDWVVWEPGPWRPVSQKTTIKVEAKKSERRGGEALAMRLRLSAQSKKRSVTLGRDDENDLVVNDATLSRVHLTFEAAPSGGWLMLDNGSRNGSFLNDEKLEWGKSYPLKDGDHIQAGQVHLRFHTCKGMYGRLKLGW